MDVAVIGINHNIAPIEIREKVYFSESRKIAATTDLTEKGIEEILILSTCNRSEIFVASSKIEEAAKLVKEFYISFFKDKIIEKYIFTKTKDEAVLHVYEVCCGFDSIVIGEDQILGQVKDALETAIELKGSSKILNKLFREAITVSKKIKTNTKLSEKPLSVSYLGVKKLREETEDFADKKVLCLGLGKMGILALTHIREYGAEKIFVCNRNILKSLEIKQQFNDIEVVEYENLNKITSDIDLLICATSSPHTIIKEDSIDTNRRKPLYILDLAVPRDVDKNVAFIRNVHLYDVDSLKVETEENKRVRKELLAESRGAIEESIREFNIWKNSIKIDPVLESINKKCKDIKEDSLSYIYRKINLSHRDKKIIDKMVEASMKRLLREAILNLKGTMEEEKLDEYVVVLNELFEFK